MVGEGAFEEFRGRSGRWLELVARVRPGVDSLQVRMQLETISDRLALAYPASNKGMKFDIISETDRRRRALRPTLFLMSGVGLVLLIACANVAGLLLAQSERRRREIAMRQALGAGRGRVIRQLFVESVLLALLGGLLGLALAWRLINDTQAMALYEVLTERLRALPGVKQASYARRPMLLDEEGGESQEVTIPAVHPGEDEHGVSIRYNIVSPDYIATMGTRVLRGRGLELGDGPTSPKVVLINQSMASRFWPEGNAIGQWLRIGNGQYQVVGVVEDGKYLTIHEPPQPYLFFPFAQMFSGEASLFIEMDRDSHELVEAILREARSVDQQVPIVSAITLKDQMRRVLYEDRMAAGLLGSLALLGIFLAAVGLYGVGSYAVSRRIREIGIRMALGARSRDVAKLVLEQSSKLVLGGVLADLAIALALTRFISSIVYGVKPTDPLALLGGCLVAVVVSLVAGYVPARRATKVDPMTALRYE
jgi:predicted permease